MPLRTVTAAGLLVATVLSPTVSGALVPTTTAILRHTSRPIARAASPLLFDDLNDLWTRYVLLRPDGCDLEEDVPPHPLGTTCETSRTPGTLRTVVLCCVLCTLAAIPALLANPLVLPRLIEVC